MATLAKRLANNAPAERMRRTINDLVTQINGGGPLQVSALGVGIAPPAAGITSADRLWVIKSQSALFTSLFSNTDTTHGTASSEVEILTGGASGGDPILHLSTGVLDAAIGLDNSDSDALVIAYNSATPGTNNVVRIDATTLDVLSGSFKVSASTVEAHKTLLADVVAAAALRAHVVVQRSGTTHGSLGLDASDRLVLMDSTPAVAATVYTVGSTAMLLARVPCVRLTASGTVCGSASTVQLQMDASVYDNDSMYDSANKRIVIQHAGKYGLAGSAYYAALDADVPQRGDGPHPGDRLESGRHVRRARCLPQPGDRRQSRGGRLHHRGRLPGHRRQPDRGRQLHGEFCVGLKRGIYGLHHDTPDGRAPRSP
jgi:hypothetical protein